VAIEEFLFSISDALRWPVLVLALVGLAWSLVEAGILFAEMWKRRWRSFTGLEEAVFEAGLALSRRDDIGAMSALSAVSWNRSMQRAMEAIVTYRWKPDAANRIAKSLADYDYRSLKRLERTRILVRMGPALGLMGTLIPLSPALAGLAEGNVTQLTDNLRVAFGVTVAGLLTGAVAFAVSLVRDRLYAQDFSDVEFAAAELAPQTSLPGGEAPSSTEHGGSTTIAMGNP
jgi:biopolymer transport protein ExbB/TolQ